MNPLTIEWIEKAEQDYRVAIRESRVKKARLMVLYTFMRNNAQISDGDRRSIYRTYSGEMYQTRAGSGETYKARTGEKKHQEEKIGPAVEPDNMTDKPYYIGHRKRLRERFQKVGAEGLHDYELLELLLTYTIPQKDVKPLAKDLIEQFGSLSGVLDASQKELEMTPSLGPISATLVWLVKELCGVYLAEKMKHRDLLSSPQAVVDFARVKLAGFPHEAFMVIYVNTKNEVIKHEVIHEGTVDRAVIYPRRIIESALAYHATGLILIHNHPSGHSEPSEEDKRLTHTIIEAARTMDIRVLDHIVVAKNGYFSFVENRLLSAVIQPTKPLSS